LNEKNGAVRLMNVGHGNVVIAGQILARRLGSDRGPAE